VGEMIGRAIKPSLMLTIPTLALTATISICIGLVSAFNRGRALDRTLMFLAVIGMSISVLVYIILGQYFGAFWLNRQLGFQLFAISGYKPGNEFWVTFFALPVLINVVVA